MIPEAQSLHIGNVDARNRCIVSGRCSVFTTVGFGCASCFATGWFTGCPALYLLAPCCLASLVACYTSTGVFLRKLTIGKVLESIGRRPGANVHLMIGIFLAETKQSWLCICVTCMMARPGKGGPISACIIGLRKRSRGALARWVAFIKQITFLNPSDLKNELTLHLDLRPQV